MESKETIAPPLTARSRLLNKNVPTLKDLCLRVLVVNVHLVDNVGDAPYPMIKTVLWRMQPNQLLAIEASSPHIAIEDAEIWHSHVCRDYPATVPAESLSFQAQSQLQSPPPSQSGPTDEGAVEAYDWRQHYLSAAADRQQRMRVAEARLKEHHEQYMAGKSLKRAREMGLESLKTIKRRKSGWGAPLPPPRPKTLVDKARSTSRRITTIYHSGHGTASASAFGSSAMHLQSRPVAPRPRPPAALKMPQPILPSLVVTPNNGRLPSSLSPPPHTSGPSPLATRCSTSKPGVTVKTKTITQSIPINSRAGGGTISPPPISTASSSRRNSFDSPSSPKSRSLSPTSPSRSRSGSGDEAHFVASKPPPPVVTLLDVGLAGGGGSNVRRSPYAAVSVAKGLFMPKSGMAPRRSVASGLGKER